MTDAATPADDARPLDRTKSEATRRRDDSVGDHHKNIFQRIWLFIRQIVWEMKKVRYPTGRETWNYFLVVIAFVAVLMVFTGVVDLAFAKLNLLVFG